MKLDLLDSPLTLSLILYVLVLLIVYVNKPELFQNNKKNNQSNQSDDKTSDTFLNRNIQLILLLMPILIYGFVSSLVTITNRKKYCKLLNMKNIDLNKLLKK